MVIKLVTKLLKLLYLDVWIPANFYFSVFYGQISQLKILAEIMVFVGILWLYFTGHVLTHKELLGVFVVFFLLGMGGGFALVRLGIPQKANKLNNEVNPQLVEILERIKTIEHELRLKSEV